MQQIAALYIALMLTGSPAITHAQSESDGKIMEKARAAYSTGPIPTSISCGVAVDWDGFFQKMKIEQTDEIKARLAKLKNIKLNVMTSGQEQTDVKIESVETLNNNISDGLRQQLQGFFQIYWSVGYGRILGKKGETIELTEVPEGHVVKATSGPTKVTLEMNKAYLITRANIESSQMNAVMTPDFKPGEDGLLRLRGLEETINMGATKMVVNIALDYQKAGRYDIPQHISMGLKDSYGFDYTLNGCQVKGDEDTSSKPVSK